MADCVPRAQAFSCRQARSCAPGRRRGEGAAVRQPDAVWDGARGGRPGGPAAHDANAPGRTPPARRGRHARQHPAPLLVRLCARRRRRRSGGVDHDVRRRRPRGQPLCRLSPLLRDSRRRADAPRRRRGRDRDLCAPLPRRRWRPHGRCARAAPPGALPRSGAQAAGAPIVTAVRAALDRRHAALVARAAPCARPGCVHHDPQRGCHSRAGRVDRVPPHAGVRPLLHLPPPRRRAPGTAVDRRRQERHRNGGRGRCAGTASVPGAPARLHRRRDRDRRRLAAAGPCGAADAGGRPAHAADRRQQPLRAHVWHAGRVDRRL